MSKNRGEKMITPNYNFYSYAESVYENLKKRNNSEKSKN